MKLEAEVIKLEKAHIDKLISDYLALKGKNTKNITYKIVNNNEDDLGDFYVEIVYTSE